MKKKHFIFLGRVGLIYYSWLLVILFIGLIVGYESANNIDPAAIIIIALFLILLGYTLINSYWQNSTFKLPFKKKQELTKPPVFLNSWWHLKLYVAKPTKYQKYYFIRWERR